MKTSKVGGAEFGWEILSETSLFKISLNIVQGRCLSVEEIQGTVQVPSACSGDKEASRMDQPGSDSLWSRARLLQAATLLAAISHVEW